MYVKSGYEALLNVSAEMILDRVFKNIRLQTIYTEIDDALDKKDKQEFMRLTNELKML
ncbi:hypothetical protein D3C74_213560 [compost metagenome]